MCKQASPSRHYAACSALCNSAGPRGERGAVLVIGMVILLLVMALATSGYRHFIVHEQVAVNYQWKMQADQTAENRIAETLENTSLIDSALLRLQNGMVVDQVAVPVDNETTSQSEVTLSVRKVPTTSYSAGLVETFVLQIDADVDYAAAGSEVSRGFSRMVGRSN